MEPTRRELDDKIAEIREWLVRIDTKVDFLNEVKRTAEEAESKADEALTLSKANKEAIVEIKANDKWKWSAILTILGIMVSIGIAYFN